MKDKVPDFEERQNLGTNKHTLSLRIFLALFCFVAYYFTDVPEINGDLLFIVGIAILLISLVLLFVTHIHITVNDGNIHFESSLKSSSVKIPVNSIVSVEKTKYSNYIINYPVYNLHRDGVISFYTGGKDAVKLTSRDGVVYLIGTHKPEELARVISEQAGLK